MYLSGVPHASATVVQFGEWDAHTMDREGDEISSQILERDPRLAEIVRRLVVAYSPEMIYLFGSTARTDADADSDYDLMVIVADDAPAERTRSRLAYQVLRGTGVAADVLVSTRSRFTRRAAVAASLPATVIREGRLVHAV